MFGIFFGGVRQWESLQAPSQEPGALSLELANHRAFGPNVDGCRFDRTEPWYIFDERMPQLIKPRDFGAKPRRRSV